MDRHRGARLESRLKRERGPIKGARKALAVGIAEFNLAPALFSLGSRLQQKSWSECRSLGERYGMKNSGRSCGTQ
jgi:hypothetical protein